MNCAGHSSFVVGTGITLQPAADGAAPGDAPLVCVGNVGGQQQPPTLQDDFRALSSGDTMAG